MKSPGTYHYPWIEDDMATEMQGVPAIPFDQPLTSSPVLSWPYELLDGTRRTATVEWLPPKRTRRGKHHVQIRIGGTTLFSIAIVTPKGGHAQLRPMFEDCSGFIVADESEELVLSLLALDHQARCGIPRAVGAVAAAEIGLFFQRVASSQAPEPLAAAAEVA